MKISVHPVLVEFEKRDGSLYIPFIELLISSHLTRDEFLKKHPPIGLLENPEKIETFYFEHPVELWKVQFSLAIAFRPHTHPYCTAYRLQPLAHIEQEFCEDTKNIRNLEYLLSILVPHIGNPTRQFPELNKAVWDFNWGIISVGYVIQDSSPYAISVGWTPHQRSNAT